MKRVLLIILALALSLPAFSSCGKECDHQWERVTNYDQHTSVDKCSECEETRMYTDRDSVPDSRTDEDQLPQVPSAFPNDPPALFVRDGEKRIKAWRGTSSWIVEGEDGISNGINSDSPHPLDCIDSLPVIEFSWKTTLTLSFEGAPVRITVKQYPADASGYDDYKEIEVNKSTVEVKAGNYIYEVIATWHGETYSGTVYYAFRTER